MFTGLVEGKVPLIEKVDGPDGSRLTVDLGPLADGVAVGDSIALDGCCLTVIELRDTTAGFDAIPETIDRTSLSARGVGDELNAERSLRVGDRLGGHWVTGHIDAVGRVVATARRGIERAVDVEAPERFRRYLLEKGSVAVDGVSLTIAAKLEVGFRVALIPHTDAVTTASRWVEGAEVNLEFDVLGKWVESLMPGGVPLSPPPVS